MDWIYGIRNAIDSIEDPLTEEIDYEEEAKQSFSSSNHFQRIFGLLCGYSLGKTHPASQNAPCRCRT